MGDRDDGTVWATLACALGEKLHGLALPRVAQHDGVKISPLADTQSLFKICRRRGLEA
jgi:hypothetical protein